MADITGTMADQGDGTYIYYYNIPLDGEITILVSIGGTANVYMEWFPNTSWTAPISSISSYPNLDISWSSGTVLTNGMTTGVTGYIYTQLKAPYTETYSFTLNHDDGSKFLLDGVTKVDRQGISGAHTDTFTASLVAGEYYDVFIYYYQDGGPAKMKLSWSSASISSQIIPSTYYHYVQYLGSSPFQITVNCPTGYSGTDPSSPMQCKEI